MAPTFTGNHSVYWLRPHDRRCTNMDTRTLKRPIRKVGGEKTRWPRFKAKDIGDVLLVVTDASMQRREHVASHADGARHI